jgi:hypothetical protein
MDTGDGILGTNMYAYCQNDPVNFCDSSGTKKYPAAYSINVDQIAKMLSMMTNGWIPASSFSSAALSLAAQMGVQHFADTFFSNKLKGAASNILITEMRTAWEGLVTIGSATFNVGDKNYLMTFWMGEPYDILAYSSDLIRQARASQKDEAMLDGAVDAFLWAFSPGLDMIGSWFASAFTSAAGLGPVEFPIGTWLAGSKTVYDIVSPFVEAMLVTQAEYLNGAALDFITANKRFSSGIRIFLPTGLFQIRKNGSLKKVWAS